METIKQAAADKLAEHHQCQSEQQAGDARILASCQRADPAAETQRQKN